MKAYPIVSLFSSYNTTEREESASHRGAERHKTGDSLSETECPGS